MKNRSPLLAAFLSLSFAVAVWYGTSAIKDDQVVSWENNTWTYVE